jgi:hypothetical protein
MISRTNDNGSSESVVNATVTSSSLDLSALTRLSHLISGSSGALSSLLRPVVNGNTPEMKSPSTESVVSSKDHLLDSILQQAQSSASLHSFVEPLKHESIDTQVKSPLPNVLKVDSMSTEVKSDQSAENGPKPFVCHLCPFTCVEKVRYNAHMDAHFEHRCVLCGYGSRTKGRLNRHIREFHKELAEQMNLNSSAGRRRSAATVSQSTGVSSNATLNRKRKEPSSNLEGETNDRKSNKKAKRDDDDKSIHRSDSIDTSNMAESSDDGVTSKADDVGLSGRSEAVEGADSGDNADQGDRGANSPEVDGVGRSSRVGAQRSRFKCKQCNHVSASKTEYWEHSRSHMKQEKMLKCPECDFITEYKHHLEYHLRNHFNSKPFKCIRCSYSCVNKSMLASHLKSHSNVYQYRCSDCSYATKYCHSLKLHLRKYQHRPDKVLNLDGSENPYPIIDVYGTRRGPRPKKGAGSLRLVRQVLQNGAPPITPEETPLVETVNKESLPTAEEQLLMRLMRSQDEKETKVDEQLNSIIEQQLRANEAVAAAAAAAAVTASSITNANAEGASSDTLPSNTRSKVISKAITSAKKACSSTVKVKPSVDRTEAVKGGRSSTRRSALPTAVESVSHSIDSLACESDSTNQPLNLTTSSATSSKSKQAKPMLNVQDGRRSTSILSNGASTSLPSLSFAQALQQSLWSQLTLQLMQSSSQSMSATSSPSPSFCSAPLLSSMAINPLAYSLLQSNGSLHSTQHQLQLQQLIGANMTTGSAPINPNLLRSFVTELTSSDLKPTSSVSSTSSAPFDYSRKVDHLSSSLPSNGSSLTSGSVTPEMNDLLGYSMLLLKMHQLSEPRDRLTSSSSRNSSEANSVD